MKNELSFECRVTHGQIDERTSKSVTDALRRLEGRRVRLTLREVKKRRSTPQNAFYWAVVIPIVQGMFEEAGTMLDAEEVHTYLKEHIGGLRKVIADPSGVMVKMVDTSTKLSTMEWEDYITRIRAWAAAFDVAIPLPNEDLSQPQEYAHDQA